MNTNRIDFETLARESRGARPHPVKPEVLATHLTFQDRESYLAWVAEWKGAYAQLVTRIREEKAELRRPHVQPRAAELMWARVLSRQEARTLLDLRRLGKEEAGRQRARTRRQEDAA